MTGCGRKIGDFSCCTVVCGDCLELMKCLPDGCVEAVITDPPYNCGKDYGPLTNDHREWPEWIAWFDAVLLEMKRVSRDVFSFLSQTAYKKYLRLGEHEIDWTVVWSKPLSLAVCALPFMPHWEPIAYWGLTRKRDKAFWGSDVIQVNVTPNTFGHPTEKPENLMLNMIKKIDPQSILDPFLGSGTTAVAAKKLGRHFLGFEINPDYCKIAEERLDLVDRQGNLCVPIPEQIDLI